MKNFANLKNLILFLEAEVAPSGQINFQNRYQSATALVVSPGNPSHYQNQKDKWGAELRVYFNDSSFYDHLKKCGLHVEFPRKGYKSGAYSFRLNNNECWWELVEDHGFRLGMV